MYIHVYIDIVAYTCCITWWYMHAPPRTPVTAAFLTIFTVFICAALMPRQKRFFWFELNPEAKKFKNKQTENVSVLFS